MGYVENYSRRFNDETALNDTQDVFHDLFSSVKKVCFPDDIDPEFEKTASGLYEMHVTCVYSLASSLFVQLSALKSVDDNYGKISLSINYTKPVPKFFASRFFKIKQIKKEISPLEKLASDFGLTFESLKISSLPSLSKIKNY
jgi:hypothetical protein